MDRMLERNNARVSLSLSRFIETTMATIRRIVTRTRETENEVRTSTIRGGEKVARR